MGCTTSSRPQDGKGNLPEPYGSPSSQISECRVVDYDGSPRMGRKQLQAAESLCSDQGHGNGTCMCSATEWTSYPVVEQPRRAAAAVDLDADIESDGNVCYAESESVGQSLKRAGKEVMNCDTGARAEKENARVFVQQHVEDLTHTGIRREDNVRQLANTADDNTNVPIRSDRNMDISEEKVMLQQPGLDDR